MVVPILYHQVLGHIVVRVGDAVHAIAVGGVDVFSKFPVADTRGGETVTSDFAWEGFFDRDTSEGGEGATEGVTRYGEIVACEGMVRRM